MDEIHTKLKALVLEACVYPRTHPRRRKLTNAIVRLVQASGKLYRQPGVGYEEALQQTWLYFARNLCEATTAKAPYDPDRATLVTWLNAYLQQRLRDGAIAAAQENQTRALPQRDAETGRWLDPLERVPAAADVALLYDRLLDWLENGSDPGLQASATRKRPDVTARSVLRRRLQGTTLKEVAARLGVPEGTMRDFGGGRASRCCWHF